jgi:two-component system cell cycle sensor histidine kinase/response regulator CckA
MNGDGTVREWVGMVDDVEEQRHAEEQLQQAQRIQAVGKLAGGVAHEVKNMMTAVIGFGEFVLTDLGPRHPQRADVEEILRAGHRAAAVSRQLLAFSRQQILQPTVLSLNLVIEKLAALLARLVGADKALRLHLDPEAGRVRADRSQLEQILVDLAVNGRDAMASVGRLTIETAAVTLDAEYAAAHPNVRMRTGRYALLAVSDTGAGMPPDVQARAFEPFYTTKPIGEGTGLGLSTVYGIVKQSGGYIWLYSELDLGTTVKVYLPLVPNEMEAQPQPTPPPAPRGCETVLVVEDEPMVRRPARRALEGHGYQVLEAATGSEALELLARSGTAQVRLVVCDVVMPEVNGRELGAELRRRQPTLPVLYMSGYTGEDVVQRGLLTAGEPFIQKTFTPELLAERVRDLLDGGGPPEV